MTGVVIIGGGQAGFQCAETLRQKGFEGRIALIGEEAHSPYQRPPLSKAYLLGETDRERLKFRNDDWYEKHGIDLLLSAVAEQIERSSRQVILSTGKRLSYDRLVLATGARVRKLPVPGAELDSVCYLKTIDDLDRIEQRLSEASSVVVIGAGFIGLEFAAVACKLGKDVVVIEAADRVMGRAVTPQLSEFFQSAHEKRGVRIFCNQPVQEIKGSGGKVRGVRTNGTTIFPAELVVAGIGVVPNTALAEDAGLVCDNGIAVDACGRTSDPDIYAAGDCASVVLPFAGERIRLESVQNAVDQGKITAASIAGETDEYSAVPWFWSDQFDLKLQMAGLSSRCDQHVVRGDMAAEKFSIFHFRDGELRAVDAVNKAADYLMGRKLLEAGISPTPEQAADETFRLKSLLA